MPSSRFRDMGAAGLTSSSVEMASKGGAGIRLDMNTVPCRETGMTPYEMMLSESQERMLMVLKPGREAEAEAIFRKWELDFAVIGEVTDALEDGGHMVLEFNGEVVCDIPLAPLADDAPLYDRPYLSKEEYKAWAKVTPLVEVAFQRRHSRLDLLTHDGLARSGVTPVDCRTIRFAGRCRYAPDRGRCGRGAGAWHHQSACHHHRLHPALCLSPTPMKAASRPSPRRIATCAPWVRGPWR